MIASTLWPGQLPAFAGLRALRDLDLQLVGVDQVVRGDAEAAGRDLLDGAAPNRRCVALKRSSRSPPSPVLLLPPMRFMAMARFSWASPLIEPKLIAPVAKRLTISVAGSTSSIGIGLSLSTSSHMPRRVMSPIVEICELMSAAYSL